MVLLFYLKMKSYFIYERYISIFKNIYILKIISKKVML